MPRFTFENKLTVGNLVQLAIILLGGIGLYYGLVDKVNANTRDITSLQEIVRASTDLSQRVATIETRINIGFAAREAFQAETKQAFKEQAAILSSILQTQAAILARMEDAKRGQ